MKKTNLILVMGLLTGLNLNSVKGAAAADNVNYDIIDNDFVEVSIDTLNLEGSTGEITRKHLRNLLDKAEESRQSLQAFIENQLQPETLWKVFFNNETNDLDNLKFFKLMNNENAKELLKFAYDHVNNNYNNHCRELIFRKYVPDNCLGQNATSLINKNKFIDLIVAWTADPLSWDIFKDYFLSKIDQSLKFQSRLPEFYSRILSLKNELKPSSEFSFVELVNDSDTL